MRKYWMFLAGLLYTTLLSAQLLPVRNYSTQQGLPQNQVMRIMQDSKGFIWFRTQGGVARFDGYNFKNYTITNGLPTNNIRTISEFQNNYYFLANNSITVLEKDSLKIYDNKYFKKTLNETILHTYYYLDQNPDNSRLFVASENKIFYQKGKNKTFKLFYDLTKLPDKPRKSDFYVDYCYEDMFFIQGQNHAFLVDVTQNRIINISETLGFKVNESLSCQFLSLDTKKENFIFVYNDLASEQTIWYYYNHKNNAFKKIIEATNIQFLVEKNKKNELDYFRLNQNELLLVTSTGNIYSLNINNGDIKKTEHFVKANPFILKSLTDLYVTGKSLWISSNQGLIEYNFSTHNTFTYTTENGLSNNNIQTMLIDKENNIWLGTNGTGVDMIVPGSITNYTDKNGLSHSGTSNTVQGNDGSIWISTDNGLTRFFTDGSYKHYGKKDGLADSDVWGLAKDLKGNIWVGTYNNGIYRFDGKRFINMRPKNMEKSGNYTSEIYVDSNGNVWVPSYYNLLKFSPDYKVSIIKYEVPTVVYQIIEDENKNLILAAADKGLYLYSQDGKQLAHYPVDKNIFDSNIIGVELTDQNSLCCFTYGEGIIKFNRKTHTYEKILETETRGFEIMKCYVRDRNKNLWIGTINGILKITPQNIIQQFTKEDGLAGNDIRSTGAYLDQQGIIWFNSSFGVIRINPVEQFADKTAPSIYITEFSMNQPVNLHQKDFEFDYKHNTASFKFVGLEYRNPTRVLYQYYLENFDKTWSDYSNDRSVRYTNLDPGRYRFHVRAKDHSGNVSKTTTLEFVIHPPIWMTWWFIVLEVSALVGIVILIMKWRMRSLKEKNEYLENQVALRTRQLREKNELLISSIRYAERIQHAILPHTEQLDTVFRDHFIIYLPKDIISGDFYWFAETEESYYFAVVDCTGHGVPGALLSIVGNMLFNEIVNQNHLARPSEILEHLHESVKTVLCQNGHGHNRDGMEVVLCQFSKDFETLIYAGANRPLYIYNNVSGSEPQVYRPDRKGIGGRQREEKRIFNDHIINLKNHDMIYLLSDGFVDQANNENHKFGSRRLKEIFREINSLPVEEQRKILLDNLAQHKQNEIQRDDITLIGISISNDKEL